jgi:hypothetical protein
MSQIAYADPAAPSPDLGVPQAPRTEMDQLRVRRLLWASVTPAAICLGVNFIFFMTYWLPETYRFPGRPGLLTALSPLASKWLTSGGTNLVDIQRSQLGIAPTLLLILSLVIAWAARTRYWLARVWLPGPVVAGWIVCIVNVAVLAHRHQLSICALSVLLMILWVVAAGAAGWWTMAIDVDSLPPKRRYSGLIPLAAYVILGAPATAVGRSLFAPELRQVANKLQFNDAALRTAALGLPANFWIYLSGVLVGVVVWVAYQLLPARRDFRSVVLAAALIASVIFTAAVGWSVAGPSAAAQAKRLTTASPQGHLRLTCGLWVADPAAPVQRTLVIDDFNCTRVTVYQGYVQLTSRRMAESASPVIVGTPEGQQINNRVAAAQYGSVLVVVVSNRRDGQATSVIGLQMADGSRVWQYRCDQGGRLTVRFAGVPGGDHPGLGQLTLSGEGSSVAVGCPTLMKHLNPATGLGAT